MPIDVQFPGNLGQVDTIAKLRQVPTSGVDAETIYIAMDVGRTYSFDFGSLLNDDGINVIRPNDRMPLQAGRFIYLVDGFAPGRPGDPGPKGEGLETVTAPGGSAFVGYKRPSGVTATQNVNVAVASLGITAGNFGAKFDGVTDDTAAIQAMVNDAALTGVPVLLPAGTAIIRSPIVFTDKRVSIRGVFGKTIIKAGAAMDRMFDLRNSEAGNDDGSFSPATFEGFSLDGSNTAQCGLDLRYIHSFDMRNVRVYACTTGLRELDTWLSRYHNVRVDSCAVGWDVVGAANSTVRSGCTITGCTDTHLRIRGAGTFSGSTEAMIWSALDVEFGDGNGIDVGANCYVTFDDCYLFEGVKGVGIINRGLTTIRGGNFYIGNLESAIGVKPLANSLLLERVTINGGNFGGLNSSLVGLSEAEASGAIGTVEFRDVQCNFPPSVVNGLRGDFLAFARPGSNLVPRYGKDWQVTPAATLPTNEVLTDGRARKITAVSGTDFLGFYTLLKSREYTIGKPFYQVYVIEANCPIYVQLATDPGGAAPNAFVAAQSTVLTGKFTLIVPNTNAGTGAYTHLNIVRNGTPQAGDFITLHSASFADASLVQANVGSLATLVKL